MKIIEGLKEIKRLEEKVADLEQKISKYCADLDFETPTYPDQKGQVNGWLQSIHDSLKSGMDIRIRIQRTNLSTQVPVELGGKSVIHSIAEWIIRRRLYAAQELRGWNVLSHKGLKEGTGKTSAGADMAVKVRLYFDPIERDKNVEIFRGEPGIIDRTLEVINATTDIVE